MCNLKLLSSHIRKKCVKPVSVDANTKVKQEKWTSLQGHNPHFSSSSQHWREMFDFGIRADSRKQMRMNRQILWLRLVAFGWIWDLSLSLSLSFSFAHSLTRSVLSFFVFFFSALFKRFCLCFVSFPHLLLFLAKFLSSLTTRIFFDFRSFH